MKQGLHVSRYASHFCIASAIHYWCMGIVLLGKYQWKETETRPDINCYLCSKQPDNPLTI